MAIYNLKVPITEEQVRNLKVGDLVTISGEIVSTVGLPTHQRLIKCIEEGKAPPVEIDNVFLHLGGSMREINGKQEIVFMNPTTSTRFNPQMPQIIRHFNLRVTGGKAGLDSKSVEAMKEVGCVFLSFLGAGAYGLTRAVREVKAVGWGELIFHYRLLRFSVDKLGPAVVSIDAHGHSIYSEVEAGIKKQTPAILAELAKSAVDIAALTGTKQH